MFKVFINASYCIGCDSPDGSYYKFVDYDCFKQILDHLFVNKFKNNESIEVCYSTCIHKLRHCVDKYKMDRPDSKISTHPVISSIDFCKNGSIDAFIIFQSSGPSGSITDRLKSDFEFKNISKRIIHLDKDGKIICYETV